MIDVDPELTIEKITERATTCGLLDEILRRTGSSHHPAEEELPEIIMEKARMISLYRVMARVEDEDADF